MHRAMLLSLWFRHWRERRSYEVSVIDLLTLAQLSELLELHLHVAGKLVRVRGGKYFPVALLLA